jgi:hypothetical protein
LVPGTIQGQYGDYSGPDSSKLLTIAHAHTQGALTPLQAAVDLQNWLQSSAFTYTLRPNLPKTHWLRSFLTTDRRGYCQQFAWAFAVLARLIGIPSRIAIGYTSGTRDKHGSWHVTSANAHAWPELYFPGEGWLRFEPTPHGAGGQGTATVPRYASGPSTGPGGAVPGGGSKTPANLGGSAGLGKRTPTLNHFTHVQPGEASAVTAQSDAGFWLAIGISVLLVMLVTWPALIRLGTRRRRWLLAQDDAGKAQAAWRELTDDLADLGLPCAPGETPRAVAGRITQQAILAALPAEQALTRVAMAEERARYARLAVPGGRLAADVRTVRRAVAASVTPKQRLRARLLPASTLTAARHLVERAGGMLGWIDSSWPAVRRQLRRAVARRPA